MTRVLVTGAGGFVGDWLTHRLALATDFDVVPLVHRCSGRHAMRLARLPLELHQGSVLNEPLMAELAAECDAIVHCAVGTEETTVEGTKVLASVAANAGIQDFVQLSSASVHGHTFDGWIDETAPLNLDTAYATWKIAAEAALDNQSGIEPTVLRPFIVYGPFSEFVEEPLAAIESGAVLVDGGRGTLNGVYIDNLVDAILAVLESDTARGRTYLLADDEHITWQAYYRRLGAALDEHPPIQSRSAATVRRQRRIAAVHDWVDPPIRIVESILASQSVRQTAHRELGQAPWARWIYQHLPDDVIATLQGRVSTDTSADSSTPPPARDVDPAGLPAPRYAWMHGSTGHIRTDQITKDVGWHPRVDVETALDRVAAWIASERGAHPDTTPLTDETTDSRPLVDPPFQG